MHPNLGRPLVTIASALAMAVAVADAQADTAPPPPADLSQSHMECGPVTPDAATRPGDDALCVLTVNVRSGFGYDATADITVPAGTSYDPAAERNYQGVPDDPAHATVVHYDTKQLGFLTAGQPKTVQIQLHINDDGTLKPGDAIAPVATVRASNAPDFTTTATEGVVMPPAAVLDPSTITCEDDNGPPLRPNDQLSCAIHLADVAVHEDATLPGAQVQIPLGTVWSPGGNETFHDALNLWWLSGGLPTIVSGAAPITPITFRLAVAPSTWPGTKVAVSAIITYTNSLSHTPGRHPILGPGFVTAPGPAVLTASALACSDADGAPLYAGDTVNCTLTVADAAGRENIADVTARAPVPSGTSSPQAGGGDTVVFGSSVFGTIVSGTARAVTYQLHVASTTPAGTVVAPTADVTGRSVGTDLPVSAQLAAAPLVVAVRPGSGDAGTTPVAAAATAPATKPATPTKKPASRICTSRRVVVVNVRPPRGRHWKSVSIRFAKKSVKAKKAPGSKGRRGYFRARLVFQGLPKGPLTVTITGRTTRGKVVRSFRTYNLCAKKRTA